MKKNFILTACLLLLLMGCTTKKSDVTTDNTIHQSASASAAQTSDETESSETETGIPDENLNLMQKVLLDKAEFMDVETGRMETISNISGFSVSEYTMFYYQDLDGDGSFEVCVDSPTGRWSIFSVIDDIVYRYDYPFRGMIPLYQDGTMLGSSGASSTSLSRFTGFAKEGYTEEYIAIAHGDASGTLHYYTDFKDGNYTNEISKEEYDEILSKYPKIESEKYEFTRKNIEKIILTGTSNDELSLMQKALLNQAEFTATDGLRQIKAENIEGYPVYGGGSGSFCVVDMDGDGTNEVAVTYSVGVVIIFHEEDGAIRTYKHTFRQFNPVYSDGTFTGSGSARDSVFYGTIGFTQKGFEYSAITSVLFENDTENIHYYKGGEPSQITAVEITESEYNEIMAAYSMEEVPEYEFTRNNIERYAK